MPQTGFCTDVTCPKELTELYECHCCNWLICLKHLLEHVEISKRDKKEQLDILRNDLMSVSYSLELIVEKKLHEIEREKQLIAHAKTLVGTSEHSMEEIQHSFEEINQTILSYAKEETIVKVESSLTDCSHEKLVLSNLNSSAQNILQQPKSPIYRAFRIVSNDCEESTITKDNDHSMQVDIGLDNIMIDDPTLDSLKNEAEAEENDQENSTARRDPRLLACPITFDGAFGLTKAKHSIKLCREHACRKQNMWSHLRHKHNFKFIYVRRLLQAIRLNQDPRTTKLVEDNEVVIDPDRFMLCPFSNKMINLIGCCPPRSRNVPCHTETITTTSLLLHLKQCHYLPTGVAKKVRAIYKEKVSKMASSNCDNTTSL